MTDTKLIARLPTQATIDAAYAASGEGLRISLIEAFDAAPDLAPAPAPSEPTLRQRYAMAALTAILVGRPPMEDKSSVSRAFAIADAMIAAEGER